VPRHPLHLLRPELRVAEVDRLLHEEGRSNVLGRDLESEMPGRVLHRYGADASGARRVDYVDLITRVARVVARRPLRKRGHAIPDEATRRDSDLHRIAAFGGMAKLVLETSPARV